VTAALNLSYQDLADDQQRLFRRLGLHPGPDIDAHAAPPPSTAPAWTLPAATWRPYTAST
jgi:hypothetical protein